MTELKIDLQLVINDLANQIKRLMIENAFLKAQLQELEKQKG